MSQTPTPKQSREAQREAVKVLAIAVGVREAARQLGINENTAIQWSKRGNWFKQPEQKPVPPTITKQNGESVISVIKPSDALASVLFDNSKRTRLGFAKAAMKVAEAQAELPVSDLRMPKEALAARSWVDVAGKVHEWGRDDPGSSPLNLQVLSQNTVISIGEKGLGSASVDTLGE